MAEVKAATATAAAGSVTGYNPYVMLAVYLGSSIIGALTTKEPKVERSALDKLLEAQTKRYKEIGERRQLAANTAALISGRPASEFTGGEGDKEVLRIMRGSPMFKDYDIFQGKRGKMEEFLGTKEKYPKAVEGKPKGERPEPLPSERFEAPEGTKPGEPGFSAFKEQEEWRKEHEKDLRGEGK